MHSEKKITVGIHSFKPLVYKKDEKWTGFEIQLWERIAEKLDLKYRIVENQKFDDLLGKTAQGKYDIALAGITRTSKRAEKLYMSFLTLDTGLGIATLQQRVISFKEMIKGVFARQTFGVLLVLLLVTLLNAHIFWFIERGAAVPNEYLTGIFDSFYYSIVTFATVGYGDIAPGLVLSKIFSIVSIMVGLAIFGLYISQLTAALTLGKINARISSSRDLPDKTIGVKKHTTSVESVREKGGHVVEFQDVEDAIEALKNRKIDAVVADLPILQSLYKNTGGFILADGLFARQTYSMILSKNKDNEELLNRINLAITEIQNSGEYDILYSNYFEN